MLLRAGYDYCERFQHPISKFNFVLVLFVSCYATSFSQQCTFSASPEESEKIFKRILPLQGRTLSTTLSETGGTGSLKFEVGVCSSPNKTKAAVIVNKTIPFGSLDRALISQGMNFIQLSYEEPQSNDSNCTRWSNIMFVCDSHTDCGTMKVLETFQNNNLRCSYTFEVPTRHACEIKEGLSSGSIFCILFFTGVGLYLLLGFLYQRLLVGAKGLEQIPNYSFWKDFGNLQADGCDFFCRCGPRQEAQSYRGIDDRLPRDDERDDQLLNM